MSNPLLTVWSTPHETPPFAEIKPEHFLPAFEQAFADHKAEIDAIVADPSKPDFDNTVTALERSGKLLQKVSNVFYALVGLAISSLTSCPELRKAMEEAVRSKKPTLINAVIDETAGTESGRITSLNPTAGKKK